jgi:hypothetical protein
MNTVVVRLPKPLFQRLNAEARRRKTTKSALLVEAFERAQPNGNGGLSPYERVKDLIGSVDDPSLPTDLSSNPKHLEGYGRSRPA